MHYLRIALTAALAFTLTACGGGGGGGQTVEQAFAHVPQGAVNADVRNPGGMHGVRYSIWREGSNLRVLADAPGAENLMRPIGRLTYRGGWHGEYLTGGGARSGRMDLTTTAPTSSGAQFATSIDAHFTGGGVNERFRNVLIGSNGRFQEGSALGNVGAMINGFFFVGDGVDKAGGSFRADDVLGAFGAARQ